MLRTIKELEKRGVLQTLLLLSGNSRCKFKTLYVSGSYSTLYRAIDILLRLELVSEERDSHNSKYIQLTDNGKVIAKKINEINLLLDVYKKTKNNGDDKYKML